MAVGVATANRIIGAGSGIGRVPAATGFTAPGTPRAAVSSRAILVASTAGPRGTGVLRTAVQPVHVILVGVVVARCWHADNRIHHCARKES